MKHSHFPKQLISFRKLKGGQFGTLDVSALNPHYAQLALGSDFVSITRAQWVALRSVIDRFFGTETETVVFTDEQGEPVVFDEREVEEEEVVVQPAPQGARRPRRRPATA